ncbi:flagellar protein FliT [Geopseudomonas guangdongensis]|uniref:Flagellar protein FliT n=1 Tax=Geopseudomonas guangdongensis TaxID=1245526 RepID=A0A1H2EPL0_9GAMM|nr:flagellar protein FliT [Pseudomonas guangdongensis]SDT96893.1 flagellar protein FliT [Pseudomonas guangdongensis]
MTMSAAPQLIESYELLLQQSLRMLELARSGDWSGLLLEKSRCLIDVEKLRQCDALPGLDAKGQRRKLELLEQILELDVEIRGRLVARRDELGELIGLSRRREPQGRGSAAGAAVYEAAARFSKAQG